MLNDISMEILHVSCVCHGVYGNEAYSTLHVSGGGLGTLTHFHKAFFFQKSITTHTCWGILLQIGFDTDNSGTTHGCKMKIQEKKRDIDTGEIKVE